MDHMNFIVLCDFDGTIITIDSAEHILRVFVEGNWQHYDEQFDRNEIGLEECVVRQFAMIRASEAEIINELDAHVSVRDGFARLLDYCRSREIDFAVVSAGLDF